MQQVGGGESGESGAAHLLPPPAGWRDSGSISELIPVIFIMNHLSYLGRKKSDFRKAPP